MSKTFCSYAWMHLNFTPKGDIFPCCEMHGGTPIGTVEKNSLAEVANGDYMNNMRKAMVEEKEWHDCRYCYEKEKSGIKSIRMMINEVYQDQINNFVDDTNDDGSLKTPWKMKHYNLRISNLCNLGCRTCTPVYSSVIAQEQKIKNFVINSAVINPKLLEEIYDNLPYSESITFVGGEPTLIDEYWQILDKLIEINHTDVKIFYYTNTNKLEYKGKNLIEYMKKFPNHLLLLSIDGYGERLELLRHGSNWRIIEENIKAIRDAGLTYRVLEAISAINAWHIPDFENYLINEGLIGKLNGVIEHNIVVRSKIYSSKILPLEYKKQITEKVLNHKTFLENNNFAYLSKSWDTFIDFIYSEDYSYLIPDFIKYNENLDNLRHQNIFETFPELSILKNS